jgi:hypothetical protein
MRGCGKENSLGKLLPPEAVPHVPIPSSPHPLIHGLTLTSNPAVRTLSRTRSWTQTR